MEVSYLSNRFAWQRQEQAEGFETPSNSGEKLVYKLNKSLYGLKQSGRNWNSMLHKYLIENNFVQSNVDHCLYIKYVDGKLVIILVWVDDLIIAARNDILMSDTKQMLKDKFHMKDLQSCAKIMRLFTFW